jgi:hypothetical protein
MVEEKGGTLASPYRVVEGVVRSRQPRRSTLRSVAAAIVVAIVAAVAFFVVVIVPCDDGGTFDPISSSDDKEDDDRCCWGTFGIIPGLGVIGVENNGARLIRLSSSILA